MTLTTNDMQKARLRHWLNYSEGMYPDFALSLEIAPSQDSDGSTLGQVTWFDYAGKPQGQNGEPGTQIQPSLIARKLPDGSTSYQSFTRNSFGLPTGVTTTYGTGNPAPTRTQTYTYAANGQDLLEIRRPGNEVVAAYSYNGRHQVLTETNYANATDYYVSSWTYDALGRVQTHTTAGGLTSTYSYNASCNGYSGYLSDITDSPVSRSQTFTWLNGNVRTNIDYRGLVRTFTFDGLNRLTQIDFPAHDGIPASSIVYSYILANGRGFNNTGNPIAILERTAMQDRLGKWTYYDRDRLGRVTTVEDPLRHTTTYAYCGCGVPETITDARGKITSFVYNNAGWKMSVTYPDNTWEAYAYDPLGRMTNRTDSLGSRLYTYNNQGLLNGIVSAYGTERAVTYDIHDQPTNVVDANAVSVAQHFDRFGRMADRAVPGQNTEYFQYSARGLTNYTGPDTKVTRYVYDEALRKTGEATPKSESIGYTYNAAGDLLTLTDGRSKVTTWTNDVEGLVRAKKYHGQTFANITYSYDANQRLAWRKFWSSPTVFKQTFYGYDDAGNLLSIDYPASPDVSFTYNENNQPLTMTTAGLGTNSYTYTDAGNIWTEGGIWAKDTVTNAYHASVPRLRTGLTLAQPALFWAQSYGYDAADRLQTITSPAGTFTYGYRGPGTVWTNLALPNSAAITNCFDTAARMTGTWLRNSSGTVLNKHTYLYNTAGQRQRQALTDNGYTTYGYDDDAQLTNSLGYTSGGSPIANEQLGFVYDPGWNMTNRSVNGTPTSYGVNDLNEVTSVGGVPCTYDQNGNRLTYGQGSGTTQYTYDDENRLTRVSYSSAYRTDFTYDGLGRLRVRTEYTYSYGQWDISSITRYIYDGKRVIHERDGNNSPLVAYTRGKDLSGTLEGAGGIGGLLARSHGYYVGGWTTHNFYHADGNGNITCMVDPGQNIVASYKYDPYGRTISSSGSLATANLYRFSSKEFHSNSGLYYYLYRFYDPNTQRWLGRDAFSEVAFERFWPVGNNLFTFVDNNAIGGIDPLGLWHWYVPWSWPIWEAIWEAIQYVPPEPLSSGAGAVKCAHGIYNDYVPAVRNTYRAVQAPIDDPYTPTYGPPPPIATNPPPRVPSSPPPPRLIQIPVPGSPIPIYIDPSMGVPYFRG
ncbi:MAG TPA: RHS repeat-associated core domain-containing protein [Verrucomicrobiae bacterium]